MSRKEFVHLHLHSDFSLLDGAIQHDALAEHASKLGFSAMAATDHGNMFGAMSFYNSMKKQNVRPIIGMEAYVARGSMHERGANTEGEKGTNHLILLAKNQTGYENLVILTSLAYTKGYYYKPRMDKELLSKHSEGLVALSACMSGVPASLILRDKMDRAVCEVGEYQEIFGKGNYFLELQCHDGFEEQQSRVNAGLTEIARKLDVPLVVTNDAHFLTRDDFRAHQALLCLQTGKTIDQATMHYSPTHYVRSAEEMWHLFENQNVEALRNTMKIAEMCQFGFPKAKMHLPEYPVPEGFTIDSYFEKVAREGLESRLHELAPLHARGELKYSVEQYRTRLDHEIATIKKMGFCGYFLIVWDFIRYARDNGIPVGPGRGSAAGAIVAYAMRITDIDPLQFELLFERFLNPERVSMPDIDVDFCVRGRGQVIDYVGNFYGRENVSQIVTFGTMASRAAIKDVGRVLDIPYAEVEKIAKMIPPPQRGRNVPIGEALKTVPELKTAYEKDTRIREMLNLAQRLEGCSRHSSIHAAGVVISPRPVYELVPVFKTKAKDKERGEIDVLATQYNMNDLEKAGMLKMDFLGLTTLTIINDCLENIKREHGQSPNLNEIPLDDPAALRLFADGETEAIFQFEGDGIKEITRRLKPDGLGDIVALNALYRPGPLDSGMVDDYIDRRHGRKKITYDFKDLKDVLQSTYGVPIFQEQIMAIFQKLAGYSLGEADLVRRAMGKKKREELDAHKAKFFQQAEDRGHDRGKLEKLWQSLEGFADYAFNKCLVGDSPMVDADTGQVVTIAQIAAREVPTSHTFSFDGHQIIVNEIIEAFETGEKEVVELELENGRTLRCTPDHKFFTDQGYLPLHDILDKNLEVYFSEEVEAFTASSLEAPGQYPQNRVTIRLKKMKLVRVDPSGTEKTYNMTMRGPHHNYFTNGILTANSHSACYGVLAYQTAYLKAYYPAHFWAAVLSNELNNTDKVAKYIERARAQGIEILPPDVNLSYHGFTSTEKTIRFGLMAIKGIGESAVDAIVEARKDGPFTSIYDLAKRVDSRALNRRVLESLIKSGGLDEHPGTRAQKFAAIESVLESGARAQRDAQSGQVSLFGMLEAEMEADADATLPDVPSWSQQEQLAGEKATLGFYITGHPLASYRELLGTFSNVSYETLNKCQPNQTIKMGGMVVGYVVKNTKKGDRFCVFSLEDELGSIEVIAWPETFKRISGKISDTQAVLVTGRIEFTDDGPSKIIADDVEPLAGLRERSASLLTFYFRSGSITAEKVDQLRSLFDRHRGDCQISFEVQLPTGDIACVRPNQFVRVKSSPELLHAVQNLCAGCEVRIS